MKENFLEPPELQKQHWEEAFRGVGRRKVCVWGDPGRPWWSPQSWGVSASWSQTPLAHNLLGSSYACVSDPYTSAQEEGGHGVTPLTE